MFVTSCYNLYLVLGRCFLFVLQTKDTVRLEPRQAFAQVPNGIKLPKHF